MDDDELVSLGEGPAAIVLAGMDEATGEAFALKVYPGRADRRTRAELDKELSALGTLSELGTVLVPTEAKELPDGRFGVRMELCAQSLADLVGTFGPLSVQDVLSLGEALATTLAAAHQAGVVHGGMTPGNVLFRASGAPVLADFGLALRQAFPGDAEVGFLAPETITDGTRDERTDLYGLGALLYFALTGHSPARERPGETADELTLRVLSEPLPPIGRPGLPAGLGPLVASLLARAPMERPIDADLVATRLGATPGTAATPRPLGAPILEYGPEHAKSRRKGKTWLIAGVAAGAAVLAAALVFVLQNRPSELSVPPASTEPAITTPTADPVRVDLADPVDRGTSVELSWRGSESTLRYAVIVAGADLPRKTFLVESGTSYRVDVEPGRQYCFVVQATDSVHFYESQSKGIRGARCVR
ncbi:protein kinase [Amycolatopsis sp. OK19-0408]|uniref:Protein kinase n=1 Tax=Amycolatopsis iheyensis TaxID=2945988 RepID=A0A9X2NNB6_9PSEU|nr:protein kinase [Amycolatopsis iheyensis]MCR6489632.1 protein kinase [Amycolatopsis iheyensis]